MAETASVPDRIGKTSDEMPDKKGVFPIVGLGSSAGGLEALTQLLGHLPEKCGMAFVVVQHLDPTHKSELVHLLSKATKLPVAEAGQDMEVSAGHVYVIPPDSDLTIAGGKLHLTARNEAIGPHLPIDGFLGSLAEDRQDKAIGVILSGTGSDGTLGLSKIKASGGITFAQDPKSAKWAGMPESAITMNIVDFVLPPDAIAVELTRMEGSPYLAPRKPDAEGEAGPSGGDLTAILALLKSARNVDFTHYREPTLRRRIQRRMLLRHCRTMADYTKELEADPPEVEALYQDLLINVTRFFREPPVFDYLKAEVFPKIRKGKSPGSDIRIWVPGCATGEEVYSLAMALLETQKAETNQPSIRIFASDIDDAALEQSRLGSYPESIMNEVSPDRLARFFSKSERGYRINKSIRDLCVFTKHDLTADPPFARMDLISCRNVLIYMTPPLQKRVLLTFHYALNPTGFLLLGNSESVAGSPELFGPLDNQQKVFVRKLVTGKLPPQVFSKDYSRENWKLPDRPHSPSPTDFEHTADQLLLRKFAPPGILVNKDLDILQFRGRTMPYLELPQNKASFNLARMSSTSMFLNIRDAIKDSEANGKPSKRQGIRIQDGDKVREVALEILPVNRPDSTDTCFLILFEEPSRSDYQAADSRSVPPTPETEPDRLRQELQVAQDFLDTLREQNDAANQNLKSINEELLSSNEEQQSMNEELETAKEEMESANEELTTMNEELKSRNAELALLNNDMNNLFGSMNLPLNLIMLGEDLRIRRFTPPAGRLLGLNPKHIGISLGEITLPLKFPGLVKAIKAVIGTGEPLEKEIQDASGHWLIIHIHPYLARENQPEGAVLILHDINEVKSAQERLRETSEYSSSIVDTVPEPLVVLGGELTVQSANQSFYEYFKTVPAETEEKSIYQLGKGEWNIPKLKTLLEDILPRNNTFKDFEVELEITDLGRRIMRLNARRLLRDGGRTPMILLGFEDITERKTADHDLQLFKFICDKSNDPYFLINREARMVYVNRSAYTSLGYSEDEILSLRLEDVNPNNNLKKFIELFDMAQSTRVPPFESIHVRRDGKKFPVEYMVTGFKFDDEVLLLVVARDITIAKKSAERLFLSEEKLRQSQKMEAIGKLAGGISHDFNNLLTAINGYGEISLSMVEPQGAVYDNLMEILKAGKRAASLTRQLLSYSRKQILAPKILNLNATAKEMHKMLQRLIGENIELTTVLEPKLGMVKADPTEMEQVIINLILNARDAMLDGGRITLETHNIVLDENYAELHPLVIPGDYVLLAVTDSGTGIDEEVKARMFDPFFTTKGIGKGSGMGLSMVQGIVSQSGGYVSVYSEMGHGSCFKICLPRVKAKESIVDTASGAPVTSLEGWETVLLAEDEETVRTFTRKILEKYGYKVLEASSGKEALAIDEKHKNETIHLLLTDVIMPGMNGKELAEKFALSRPESSVVFMSGYTDDAIIRHGFVEEGTHFIQKPFTPSLLGKTLREVLEIRLSKTH